jgi:hypothetical protein
VRDTQIEDRIRAAFRREGDALPLTITPDELERRLVLRRRARTGRRLSLLAAGVGVIVIGSVLTVSNGWLQAPSVGSGPSAEPTATAIPSAAGLPCETIDPTTMDLPPTLVLGVTPGDAMAIGGALGSFRLGDRQVGDEGSWDRDTIALEPIHAGPPTERLQALAGSPDACLSGLKVDAISYAQAGEPSRLVADGSKAPIRVIEFAKPAVGDWLVRVHAEFATGDRGTAWSESFFRIVVPDPSASPSAPPERLPALGTPEGTVLLDVATPSDRPSEPTGLTKETTADQVPPRSQYRVDVVCLGGPPLRWSLGIEGQFEFLAAGDQVCDGTPGGRVIELGTPTTHLTVVLHGDPGSAWHLVVSTIAGEPAFVPPALRMMQTGNTEGSAGAAQGFGRCVSTADASDQCAGEWFVLEGARSILVPANSRLTFALQDGWQISQARITAAVTDQVRANAFAPEYSVALVEEGGPQITVPTALDAGSWIVRVALNATRDGVTFSAYYDLPLEVGA